MKSSIRILPTRSILKTGEKAIANTLAEIAKLGLNPKDADGAVKEWQASNAATEADDRAALNYPSGKTPEGK